MSNIVSIIKPCHNASRYKLKQHRVEVNKLRKAGKIVKEVSRPSALNFMFDVVTNLNNKMDEMTPQEYIKANTLLREMFDDNSIR